VPERSGGKSLDKLPGACGWRTNMGQRVGGEMMRRSELPPGGSEATDGGQRIIVPDTGAARTEAPGAREL